MHRLSCARVGLVLGLSAGATEAGAQNLAAADAARLPTGRSDGAAAASGHEPQAKGER